MSIPPKGIPPKKSFAELAQEQKQKEAEATTAAQAQEQVRKRRGDLYAREAPVQGRDAATKAIASVQEQVRAVGAPYSIPAHKQVGAELELQIRDRWLLVANYSGENFIIGLIDYDDLQGSRARPQVNYELIYELSLDEHENFYWRYKSGSLTSRSNFQPAPKREHLRLALNDELADFLLGEALRLAKASAPR